MKNIEEYIKKITTYENVKYDYIDNIVLDHCYYTQKVFNVAYVKNVMHLILYYLDKGYTPIITEINKNSNLGWSTFFDQPFCNSVKYTKASKDIN